MGSADIDSLALQAFELSRQAILVNLRFLNSAMVLLRPLPQTGATLATDGVFVRFDPAAYARQYAGEPSSCSRDLLHMTLHNVFLHTHPGAIADAACWDAACDIVVESIIDELGIASLAAARTTRQAPYLRSLASLEIRMSAEVVYRHLVDQQMPIQDLERLREPFLVDDHSLWHAPRITEQGNAAGRAEDAHEQPQGHAAAQREAPSGTRMDIPDDPHADAGHSSKRGMNDDDIVTKQKPQDARVAIGGRMADTINLDRSREQWEHAALELGVALDTHMKLWGTQGSTLSMNLDGVTRKRQDYRTFLHSFAQRSEHLRINDDEFDYVYYCYGLELYGNLPLIEPLEYAEDMRIRSLVIAIDTSGSTKDGLVRRFLEETHAVLSNETSFFSDMDVRIVQCDAHITDVARIRSERDLTTYLDALEIKGLGGTDFRPVFDYVADQVDCGAIRDLAGLLYFTDGHGAYPAKPPSWRTAFVFAGERGCDEAKVPPWAMKVALGTTRDLLDRQMG